MKVNELIERLENVVNEYGGDIEVETSMGVVYDLYVEGNKDRNTCILVDSLTDAPPEMNL